MSQTVKLSHLYAKKALPKFEKAGRCLDEYEPRLKNFAKIVTSLAAREEDERVEP
jgi:hypothetical protein